MFLQKVSALRNVNRTVGLNVCRTFSEVVSTPVAEQKVGGFAEAFEKHSKPAEEDVPVKRAPLPFATLLKNSKFVDVSRQVPGMYPTLSNPS